MATRYREYKHPSFVGTYFPLSSLSHSFDCYKNKPLLLRAQPRTYRIWNAILKIVMMKMSSTIIKHPVYDGPVALSNNLHHGLQQPSLEECVVGPKDARKVAAVP